MLQFLKSVKLSRLSVPEGIEFDGSKKQNIVLSKLALLVILIATIHLVDDGVITEPKPENYEYLVFVEFLLAFISLITYIINERKHHGFAKHFFLLSVNILLFFLNTIVPKESGSYFFFFPLMAATFIFYGYSEATKRYFYLVLTSGLFITLTLMDFNIFGLKVGVDTAHDFITNLLSSNILMVMTVRFLIKLNQKTEQNLVNHQSELKKVMEELKSKNINLEKVNSELDKFTYSVSHDLRAPLLSILGLVNLAQMEDNVKKHKEYLGMMRDMVTKLDLFIHDIMDYSRNSNLDVKREKLDIESIIDESINKHKFMDGWDKIEFSTEIDTKKRLTSDKDRVAILLNNLLSNAIKYHDFKKSRPFIKVRGFSENGIYKLSIEDNGTGIEKEHLDKVFNMFFRGNESSKGSGLGLYIVKEIVSKLEAKIQVESVKNQGSNFLLEFKNT